jgi:hypothetical protein
MEMMTILMWAIGGGFVIILGCFKVLYNEIKETRIDLGDRIYRVEEKLSSKINRVDEKLSTKIDNLDEKVTDIDRRLCRIEGSLSSRDCCMLKDDKSKKKAV